MSKKAVLILAEGFEEIEAVTVLDILRRAGINLTLAGLNSTKIKGAHGLTVIADKKVDEAGTDFDACILPGGMPGAANLASSEQVKSLILRLNEQGKVIAAICASPAIILSPLGILENKSATCYPGMQEHFSNKTEYKEKSVIVDGNIITSQSPATALLFALAIVEKISGGQTVKKLKNDIVMPL